MPNALLRFPDAVRDTASRRFRRQQRNWLAGGGEWPWRVPLGCPGEEQAAGLRAGLAEWVSAWQSWAGPGAVVWTERRWRTLGAQRLPQYLAVESPLDVAILAGDDRRWAAARRNFARLAGRWPAAASRAARWFDELAAGSERDAVTLEALLGWLESHPQSGLLPRQLPVPGMDTKWLEPRLPLVADLLGAIRGEAETGASAWAACGLRQPPTLIRVRLLDPALRRLAGGLGDFAAPASSLGAADLPVEAVYVVENLQSGLAFEDEQGAAVVMGLGYGVGMLAEIPWIARARCIYWGDIDTHGFAILNRARACLPAIESALMDEATLLRYRDLWVREAEQATGDLPYLREAERSVYAGLREQRWGPNVRLEQERIAWDEAWAALRWARRAGS